MAVLAEARLLPRMQSCPRAISKDVRGVRGLQHQLLPPHPVISLHEDLIDTQGTEHNTSKSFARVCSPQTPERKKKKKLWLLLSGVL